MPRKDELGPEAGKKTTREISRRDFLNGVSIAITGSVFGAPLARAQSVLGVPLAQIAPEKAPSYYPPALMGMRGSHDGS